MNRAFGLPVSEATGRRLAARLPRGCAQSWITRYLAESDPALARRWWGAYREKFLPSVGPVVGFREWPKWVEGKSDSDSGPIVMGIGAAASAFAIAAARAHGDEALAGRLERSLWLAAAVPGLGQAVQTTLAEAIRYQARWQGAAAGTGH